VPCREDTGTPTRITWTWHAQGHATSGGPWAVE